MYYVVPGFMCDIP